ncbi:hypothetical protein WME88_51995 [Sorangium sp. So ce216]
MADSLEDSGAKSELVQLNTAARTLLSRLHDDHIKCSGRLFSLSRSDQQLASQFSSPAQFRAAVDWLISKGLARSVNRGSFTITPHGVSASDDENLLDELLPVPPQLPVQAAGTSCAAKDVYELNAIARRLLAFLHRWHLNAAGGPFHVGPCDETFQVCELNEATYREAAGRLVSKTLAKPAGAGDMITITRRGVDVAENDGSLDRELPIAPRERAGPPGIALEVASALAEVRKIAPSLMIDDVLRAIVERDLRELEAALMHGLHKSTALLAGSITEAVLLDFCDRNRLIAQTYMKQRETFPEKVSLEKLIDIAGKEGLIKELASSLAVAVKNYRDLIHPDRERRTQPAVDDAMGGALVALLRLIVRDLRDASDDGRVGAYETKS